MKNILIVLLLFIKAASYAQLSIDTTRSPVQGSDKTITLTNLSPLPDEGEIVQQVLFSDITPADFLTYKKRYKSKIMLDSSKITLYDSTVALHTQSRTLIFPAKKDYSRYVYYKGLLKPLNLFLLHDIDGHNETGMLLLVDNVSGKKYNIESPFDYPLEPPCISPNNDYFLSYSNNLYDVNQCFIAIYKIEKNNNQKTFTLNCTAALDIDQWIVKDIVWVNDNMFAVKTAFRNTVLDDNKERIKYLRAEFSSR